MQSCSALYGRVEQRSGGKGDVCRAYLFLGLWVPHEVDTRALAAGEVHLNSTRGKLLALYAALLRFMDSARLAELVEGVEVWHWISRAYVLKEQLSRRLVVWYCCSRAVVL